MLLLDLYRHLSQTTVISEPCLLGRPSVDVNRFWPSETTVPLRLMAIVAVVYVVGVNESQTHVKVSHGANI